MGSLANKVAIITGAGRGIGRAYALAFAKEGAAVVVNDIGSGRDGAGEAGQVADDVVAEIVGAGGRAVASYDSVATREGVDAMVWTAVDKLGGVDILVNNAGILRDRTLLKMSEADWDEVIAVHLRGTFVATQAVARQLRCQGRGGRIINTSSVSGLVGNFGQGNYGAAKMGIAGLTFVAAKELARDRVTVNAIAPVALTRMTETLPHMSGASSDDLGPHFIAPVAVYLASERAAGVTGKIIGVEGPRVFEYRVVLSKGVTQDGGAPWTPDLLAERWSDILVPDPPQ